MRSVKYWKVSCLKSGVRWGSPRGGECMWQTEVAGRGGHVVVYIHVGLSSAGVVFCIHPMFPAKSTLHSYCSQYSNCTERQSCLQNKC